MSDKADFFDRARLDRIYESCNRRELVSPDPLQFLYGYSSQEDREVVALISAVLAYGRVAQILRSVAWVLERMGKSPVEFIRHSTACEIRRSLAGFRHRFTGEVELGTLLLGMKCVLEDYGGMEECFVTCLKPHAEDVVEALGHFAGHLNKCFDGGSSHLFPSPVKGSACKRPFLFLRWLTRKDCVDPGGWTRVPRHLLVVPLDTHMHRFATEAGFTSRKNADLATALEITCKFRRICPEDPVKYDFAITRHGIRSDMDFRRIGLGLKDAGG
ncbi:MAG: TIGR02757 family protein [Victivallales bacterium]|nr:TIGR02757 family protein [Victivallales bacterium]